MVVCGSKGVTYMIFLRYLFKRMVIAVLMMCVIPVVLQAYATAFLFQPFFSVKSNSEFTYSIGYQRLYEQNLFKSLYIGSRFESRHMFPHIMFDYGKYVPLTTSSKCFYSVGFNNTFESQYRASLFVTGGYMYRLSSRWSFVMKGTLPAELSSRSSSLIVSAGVHYFYGSGLSYRETSQYVKKVKKRFLWIFWIDD
ncbi:hypothetical protein DID78_00305 [Candidatus Marinamargulisbacteria bacterium SCGC AG-343-D04]|nr:hypothetical protein DID78_00305 [Candidatus Marinamargulisbacteria bacterium SCGC AG-343-D04]